MSGRPAEAAISFLKASRSSWTSYVKTYQHSYSWNLRQFLFVFVSLKEVLHHFYKVAFLILIETKKLCLDNIIQSRNNLSNYDSF